MPNVFTPEAVDKFGKNYQEKVRPEHGGSSQGGCMKAVYIGLGTLFGEDFGFRGRFHKEFFKKARAKEKTKGVPEGRFNTIDRVFRALEDEFVAFGEQTYKPSSGKWRKGDGSTVDSLEDDLILQLADAPDGSHFFGVAADRAIHSLILRIDKQGSSHEVFWMDQFSDGFDNVRAGGFVSSPNVTGALDKEMTEIGKGTTSVWLLDPDTATSVSIMLDVDEDGQEDLMAAAVEDRPRPSDLLIDL